MALTINDEIWVDGKPLTVNDIQVTEVLETVSDKIVWRNIIDLSVPQFSTTWNLRTWLDTVRPEGAVSFRITNDLIQPSMRTGELDGFNIEFINNGEIQGTGSSDWAMFITSQFKLTNNGWIRASGGEGGKGGKGGKGADIAGGTGSQTFTTSGTFTPPTGVGSVNICMIGGGGAGASGTGFSDKGGGYSGDVVSRSVSVNANVTVVIGAGGQGKAADHGGAGTESKFGSIVANGGSGGLNNGGYGGEGGERVSCGGTVHDGNALLHPYGIAYGGQGGFTDGGAGNSSTGGIGAGGGGASGSEYAGGNGGRGECRITWTSPTIVGGEGGEGGIGGSADSFISSQASGFEGALGSPSTPSGGNSGGKGGWGGTGGTWAVKGDRGAVGSDGQGGGNAGEYGEYGGSIDYAIIGSSFLLAGSDTGNVNGEISS